MFRPRSPILQADALTSEPPGKPSKWLIGINSFTPHYIPMWASQVVLVVKNPPANARDTRLSGQIPRLGRFPGGEHSNPFQYSCLKNPTNRRAWQAAVHRVAKSQTQLKRLSMHAYCLYLGTFSKLASLELADNRCSVNSSYSCITMLTYFLYIFVIFVP